MGGEGSFLTARYAAEQWVPFTCVGGVGTAVPFTLLVAGVSHVCARRTTITGALETLLAGLFAWFVLGEATTVLQLAAGALALLVILTRRVDWSGRDQAPERPHTVKVTPEVAD